MKTLSCQVDFDRIINKTLNTRDRNIIVRWLNENNIKDAVPVHVARYSDIVKLAQTVAWEMSYIGVASELMEKAKKLAERILDKSKQDKVEGVTP